MAMRHGYSHESRQTRPALVNKVVAATAVHLLVEATDLKLVNTISILGTSTILQYYSVMKAAAGFVNENLFCLHATLR